MKVSNIQFRDQLRAEDIGSVENILRSTGFFNEEEVRVACGLLEESLPAEKESGYLFLFADSEERTLGYACYGQIPCTQGSYDLYWIAVAEEARGKGIGKRLLEGVEQRVEAAGGRKLYIETSGKPLYEPTRAFYERCGYKVCAVLEDFYAPGDAKVLFERGIHS
ncbi:MAG: GNAT family N-acetyltransferase [Candidatus Omnitrophica bacterium]|nr:GNAT family N-acetyltransferase [Candidatus Omnitrophota bacterium]